MQKALLTVFWLLLLNFAEAQDIPLKADLKGAPVIAVNQQYSFNKSPSGSGSIKEFKLNPGRSNFIFKEERNSAWFIIEIPFNGILTFDLIPFQIEDDYDWMLFKYTSGLDKSIRTETATPIRSNNARNAPNLASRTGMGNGSKSAFVKPGPGNNYSAPLKVKTGDKLAFVADNIYGGKGFRLRISLKPEFEKPFVSLEGQVKDRFTNENIAAEVIVDDDSTGLLISKTYSDPVNGRYKLQVPLNRPINITASHPSYIFVTADTALNGNAEVNFLLDTPVNGKQLVLNNIHFFPNKDDLLPASMPEMDRLLTFMKSHPEWQVKITGHTNPNVFASARYLQQLSFNRAIAVKNYLIKNSIAEKRISCAGLGGKAPIVITKDPAEGLKNLRVEITLLKK